MQIILTETAELFLGKEYQQVIALDNDPDATELARERLDALGVQ